MSLGLLSAAVLLAISGAVAQIGVIAGGALVGWWLYRRIAVTESLTVAERAVRHHIVAAAALVVFAALLVVREGSL